jgi:hypothetical protein
MLAPLASLFSISRNRLVCGEFVIVAGRWWLG